MSTNKPTAAQPIDLDKLLEIADLIDENAIFSSAKDIRELVALARQQHEPSGNAGEVAASIDTAEFRELLGDFAEHNRVADRQIHAQRIISYIDARLALQAAPHAPANTLDKLWQQVKDMQEAAYTFGETCKSSVETALDGVLDLLAATPAAPHAQVKPLDGDYEVSDSSETWNEAARQVREKMKPAIDIIKSAAPVPQEAEQAAPAAVTDERAAFETWYSPLFGAPKRLGDSDQYAMGSAQGAWQAWQSRAALTQPAAPAVTDAARDVLADAKGGA